MGLNGPVGIAELAQTIQHWIVEIVWRRCISHDPGIKVLIRHAQDFLKGIQCRAIHGGNMEVCKAANKQVSLAKAPVVGTEEQLLSSFFEVCQGWSPAQMG